MTAKLTEKVRFDFLRYGNCWEDADILLKALNPERGSKILSIGSAGDNSFSLLTTNPEIVLAVDINKVQLYLIELKKICIHRLSYEDLLAFLGFEVCNRREKIFNEIKGDLSAETRQYWQANLHLIKSGVISQGKFERYFQMFANRILPCIHSSKTVEQLLSIKSRDDQENFYKEHWNNRRWRMLFHIFFSKYVLGKYGRDPQFLKEVKIPVGKSIFKSAEKHLNSINAQNNYMLRYSLTGSFGNLLPHYIRPENIEKVKDNLHKLTIKEAYAEVALREYGPFHFMNLSNIFEYMNDEGFANTAKEIIQSTESGGRLAYWNLMVPRRISKIFPGQVEYLKEISKELTEIDKGFFYKQFIVDQII